VPKAERRERKKERSRAAREAELKALKRKKALRTARNLALGFGIPVLALALFYFITNRDDADDSSSRTESNSELNDTRPAGSPELVIDPDAQYTAVLDTTEGEITLALDPKVALWDVNNFVSLARDGFYDGLSFHRASSDFVIQGGDPQGNGSGGPGYEFAGEVPAEPGYAIGTVAYANANDPGKVGSQFFIVTGSGGERLPADYALLGNVTEGLDVAQKIEGYAPATGDGPPTTAVTINKVTISGP